MSENTMELSTNNIQKQAEQRQRVSKNRPQLAGLERNQLRDEVIDEMLAGKLTQGQTLKKLRVEVLGFKQEAFAKLVNVSRKTLSDVENDKGNYSVNTVNQIFRPFGLKLGLVALNG